MNDPAPLFAKIEAFKIDEFKKLFGGKQNENEKVQTDESDVSALQAAVLKQVGSILQSTNVFILFTQNNFLSNYIAFSFIFSLNLFKKASTVLCQLLERRTIPQLKPTCPFLITLPTAQWWPYLSTFYEYADLNVGLLLRN